MSTLTSFGSRLVGAALRVETKVSMVTTAIISKTTRLRYPNLFFMDFTFLHPFSVRKVTKAVFLIRPIVERFKNGAPSKRESHIRVAEMQPAFHLHAQRNAFRRRDMRRQ